MTNGAFPSLIGISLKKIYLYITMLLIAIVFLPDSMEKAQFFFILLLPVVVSYQSFNFDKTLLKRSIIYLLIFIVTNLSTLLLHIYQLKWELTNPSGLFGWKININNWLAQIPLNDGMWLRQWSTPFLDEFFVKIYIHGFSLCLLALTIYYLLTGQPRKILIAMFAGHFLQYILILPFHFWVDGHQVWWVQNLWYGTQFSDPIEGYRTLTQPLIPSLNHVFPSMHTSIATVTILLALRESARPVRIFFCVLNIAIIISTVYLGIHWVMDVLGGILFGIATLKLADTIMAADWQPKWMLIKEKLIPSLEPQADYKLKRESSKRF